MPAVDTVFAPHAENDLTAPPPALVADGDRPTREPQVAAELRQSFCAELRRARERKGVSLDHIARATKVSGLLFAELEQCDVSRWPTGIYRRSFFRDYVGFTGLPIESTTSEFVRLFPEEDQAAPRPASPGPLRLELASDAWVQPSMTRSRAAAIDAAIVLLATALAVWAFAIGAGTAIGVVALGYHLIATALLGCSPGTWLTQHRSQSGRWWSRSSR
jgi:transcriptional regulator with XRE-family HTH domain